MSQGSFDGISGDKVSGHSKAVLLIRLSSLGWDHGPYMAIFCWNYQGCIHRHDHLNTYKAMNTCTMPIHETSNNQRKHIRTHPINQFLVSKKCISLALKPVSTRCWCLSQIRTLGTFHGSRLSRITHHMVRFHASRKGFFVPAGVFPTAWQTWWKMMSGCYG